ncbi:MAG: hypothetical protein Q8N63_09050 [Nanoarchaeota archaeon]|nr:hypothetical protein [Nanoarchaeota archaeon]
MESFESYIAQGIVRKVSPDRERAKKLIRDGKNRLKDVELLDIEKLPKFVFENIYDALRDFLLAILLNEGYNTASHEAPISYLLKKGFDVYTLNKLDRFRYKRNGSKYYGEGITIEEAKEIKEFCSQINAKLYKLLNKMF